MNVSKRNATFACLCFSSSHSDFIGEGNPPMYGDFEAQRHWMEIALHLPMKQWYVNTTDNDLNYWGLDYPPLTAYHTDFLDPSWVELKSSRGIQDGFHKVFMRITAILPFHLIYAPALLYFVCCETSSKSNSLLALALLYPGLLVIDNAHFQYNSISLGLFIFCFLFLVNQRLLLGSIFFVLSLNYKQMELYHALPIFTFILARCLKRPLLENFFARCVSVVVLVTFALLWLPFIAGGPQSVLAVLGRVFPFYRGLYEDKVASVWCAFSFVLKLIASFSAACVLLVSLPSLVVLFLRPSIRNFKLSLLICSLIFFLFSFQVHEKSILLAAIPALILIPDYHIAAVWLLHITNVSMFSLCLKDGTGAVFALFVAYYVMCSTVVRFPGRAVGLRIVLCCFRCCWILTPPQRYPHIFPLLNAVFSCTHFLLFLLYFYEYEALKRKSV
ncbi:unnamed protein product [Heligmosomoides polygyrus]|uniref:Alpha-1,3-glucosyltransferase n=1 Tax=Heligmosomoides polygyrus TaxID=6339 RepID=A0A3P7Y417_HELPZ|nr:unnamed protein product [Heligmosomoides polygyrus]